MLEVNKFPVGPGVRGVPEGFRGSRGFPGIPGGVPEVSGVFRKVFRWVPGGSGGCSGGFREVPEGSGDPGGSGGLLMEILMEILEFLMEIIRILMFQNGNPGDPEILMEIL